MNRLPGILGDIADVAGVPAAEAVANARGGTQVYLPPSPGADHWLSALIGVQAARAVCDRLTCGVGPLRVDVPLGPAGHAAKARAQVDAMLVAGRSERDIALATGYTARAIRRRRAAMTPADDRQMSFF